MKRNAKRGGVEMIVDMVVTAGGFFGEIEVAIPECAIELRDFGGGVGAAQIKRDGAIEGDDANAAIEFGEIHAPIASSRKRAEVAIVDEDFYFERERSGGTDETILEIRGIRAMLHPYALFQLCVLSGIRQRNGVCPDWNCAFEAK